MTSTVATFKSRARRRPGLVALALAFSLMLIVFVSMSGYTLLLAGANLRVENAWAATQALYAAEAGMDVALQSDSEGAIVGRCGRARYAAVVRGNRVVALGQVQRAAGAPMRRAIRAERGADGIVRGSWRPVPPAGQTRLITLLRQAEGRGQP